MDGGRAREKGGKCHEENEIEPRVDRRPLATGYCRCDDVGRQAGEGRRQRTEAAHATATLAHRARAYDGTIAQDIAPLAAELALGSTPESTGSGESTAKAADAPATAAPHAP